MLLMGNATPVTDRAVSAAVRQALSVPIARIEPCNKAVVWKFVLKELLLKSARKTRNVSSCVDLVRKLALNATAWNIARNV